MDAPVRGRDWWWVVALSFLALAFYYLNVLLIFFLVPIQVLYSRQGRRAFLYGSGIVLVGILVPGVALESGYGAFAARLVPNLLETGEVLLLLAGLLAVNSRFFGINRRVYRLLLVTGIVGAASVPLLVYASQSGQVTAAIRGMVKATISLVQSSFGVDSSSLSQISDVNKTAALLRGVIFRGYLFAFFVLIAATWRMGSIFGMRSFADRPASLSRFVLPEVVLWPVLVSWALVVADRFVHIGVVAYVAWNTGLIGAFLYALSGVGIVEHLLDRLKVTRGIRLLLSFGVLLLLLLPGVWIVVAVVLTVLGISELWVRFGRVERS